MPDSQTRTRVRNAGGAAMQSVAPAKRGLGGAIKRDPSWERAPGENAPQKVKDKGTAAPPPQ
eukprot:13653616-Alexandrium_andersonii.AAC.1